MREVWSTVGNFHGKATGNEPCSKSFSGWQDGNERARPKKKIKIPFEMFQVMFHLKAIEKTIGIL